MIYLKTRDYDALLEPMVSWGQFNRYLEIGDDFYPSRHIDVYANGIALRYDRSHWVDELGMLADMRYNQKKWLKWWGPGIEISSREFDERWEAAESSPARSLQLEGEKMSELGAVPIWIAKLEN